MLTDPEERCVVSSLGWVLSARSLLMQKLSATEVKAKIGDTSIFAITIDTAVFDRHGCNLDFPVLRKLDQFKGGPISALLSGIVIRKVINHIERDARDCFYENYLENRKRCLN